MLSAVQSQVLSNTIALSLDIYNLQKLQNFIIWNLHVFNQMGAVEPSFEEVTNIFDVGGSKGLPGASVEKIPKIKITSKNNVDASGDKACCSVCLQVYIFSNP